MQQALENDYTIRLAFDGQIRVLEINNLQGGLGVYVPKESGGLPVLARGDTGNNGGLLVAKAASVGGEVLDGLGEAAGEDVLRGVVALYMTADKNVIVMLSKESLPPFQISQEKTRKT